MSMYDSAAKLKKEFGETFGNKITDRQLWFITKIAKGARLYCKNNTAFNNFMNEIFADVAKFEQVTKKKPDGQEYRGLKIMMKDKMSNTGYEDDDM